MGWESQGLTLTVSLDAHAGEQERRHAELWCTLQWRIEVTVMEDQYDTLNPSLSYHECDRPWDDCQATKAGVKL